jgi:import inner membrane translocase subunit TIM22
MASLPPTYPCQVPIYAPGKEPLPPGLTEADRAAYLEQKKYQDYITLGMESCVAKTILAGGAGFAMGAFFSLMSSSFAYEDPYLRQQHGLAAGSRLATAPQKAREVFKEMGRGMWTSGRSFGKIGALFAGIECCIEGVRCCTPRHNTPLTLILSLVSC